MGLWNDGGLLAGVRMAAGLAVESCGDTFVVVDPVSDRAYALQGDVAVVWAAVAEGGTPDLPAAVVTDVVAGLVEQGLLVTSGGYSRRAVLRAAGASVALAGLSSIALPVAQAAASVVPGRLYAWGEGDQGQLGDNDTHDSDVPVSVLLPANTLVTGGAAGGGHCLSVTSMGAVYAWGINSHGQLGTGSTMHSNVPVQPRLPGGVVVRAVAAGEQHSLALTADGKVYAWGTNDSGQLGIGSTTDSTVPVQVQFPVGIVIEAIAAGELHSLALTNTGAVYAWGVGNNGQLGTADTMATSPVKTSLPDGVSMTAIAGGYQHSLAVASDGSVYGWGLNSEGELGNGTTSTSPQPMSVPAQLPVGKRAVGVAGGASWSVAVTADGSVYQWGRVPVAAQSSLPELLPLPNGLLGSAVAAGYGHGVVLTNTGAVYAWGDDGIAQLGDGQISDSATPVQVKLPTGTSATAIGCGCAANTSLAAVTG